MQGGIGGGSSTVTAMAVSSQVKAQEARRP